MMLAKNILRLNKEKGITLMALSRLSGVKQPTLHGWVTGRSVRSMEDLRKVCTVLEVGIHQILFGIDDPFQNGSMDLKELFKGNIQITIHKVLKDSEVHFER